MANSATPSTVPNHIAIVMDGNGRWANKRLMPRLMGHQRGVAAVTRCVDACMERGVGVLTVFAFSTENWNRPQDEVSGLMRLLIRGMRREVGKLNKKGIRLCLLGERSTLPSKIRELMEWGEATTQHNTKLVFNVCFNYGGRWDIVQAAQQVAAHGLPFTEDNLARFMSTAAVGDPDLLIRTGGETRISNFLLWQCAYSELYFSDYLWPDFDAQALDEAIAAYAGRERRFGKTSAQVQQAC
mgnify:CR=1 FL=1